MELSIKIQDMTWMNFDTVTSTSIKLTDEPNLTSKGDYEIQTTEQTVKIPQIDLQGDSRGTFTGIAHKSNG